MLTIGNIQAALRDAANNDVWETVGSGAPSNGTSGTGAGLTGPGSTYTDYTNKLVYINTGTKASPTWTGAVDLTSVQTLTNKTLTSPVITGATISGTVTNAVQSVAAAGSTQVDAAPITALSPGNILVTGANATKGALLPAAVAGKIYFLKNDDTANAVLKVWPAGTDTINALGASTNIAMAAKTAAVYMCVVTGAWLTIPLLPS